MTIQLAKSLEQLKLDAANLDWGAWCKHWGRNPAEMHPNDERALLDGCYFDLRAANRIHRFYERHLTVPKENRRVPFVLYDFWFRDILGPLFGWKRADGKRRFDKGFITTAKKSGKALAVDTPIPTPNGFVQMIDLVIGGEVFTEDGSRCRVVAKSEVMFGRECYRVTFSDGSSIVADAEHLWKTDMRRPDVRGKINTTAELARTVDGLNHSIGERQIVSVERVPSVPVQCIQVDHPSGMYLAGTSMIATHNSTVLSGLPLYMIGYDGEQEAEAYMTAVDRDQAGIIYRKTEQMLRKSKVLKRRFKITTSIKHIYDEQSGSWLEAISSDADSSDGKNPHLLIMDELHRWKDRKFFNALMYGDIQRDQPLFLMITTAGDDLQCVGFEEYEFAKDIINPSTDRYSMSHFAFICEAGFEKDETGVIRTDDQGKPIKLQWDNPQGWIEANPVILEDRTERRLAKLQAKCDEAKHSRFKKREFLRFMCNWWVSDTAETYIPWSSWEECGVPVRTDLAGKTCFAGLDLSSLIDITALCLLFPDDKGYLDLVWKFWMPEEDIQEKEERDRVPYRDWATDGWIELTPGKRVEYSYVRRAIDGVQLDEQGAALPVKYMQAAATQYRLMGIGYDPWNAEKLITELGEYSGIRCIEIRQGFKSLSQPCKRLREYVLDRKVRNGRNPVADWMIRNAVVDTDPADNIKLNKKKPKTRIDGVAAAVIAMGAYDLLPKESGAWSGAAGSGMWG